MFQKLHYENTVEFFKIVVGYIFDFSYPFHKNYLLMSETKTSYKSMDIYVEDVLYKHESESSILQSYFLLHENIDAIRKAAL